MPITLESLQTTLAERFGGVLKFGCHIDECAVCVRELRAVMLELPWSDHPDGEISSPTDIVCQRLNDAAWSSDAVRTRYCLPLALLSEATAVPCWCDAYILQTIRVSVAGAFRATASIHPDQEHRDALNEQAKKLSQVAARSAADSARSAADSAWSAAESARSAARSAARYATGSAWSAAEYAWSARSAARSAADSAWSAAESARSAAESAKSAADSAAWSARSAARYATGSAWSAAESAWSARSAAWSAAESARSAARDKALIEVVGIFIAAQGNPEAQAAWDALMAEEVANG